MRLITEAQSTLAISDLRYLCCRVMHLPLESYWRDGSVTAKINCLRHGPSGKLWWMGVNGIIFLVNCQGKKKHAYEITQEKLP